MPIKQKRSVIVVIVICSSVALYGCGNIKENSNEIVIQSPQIIKQIQTPAPTSIVSEDSPKGYISVSQSEVAFINFTEADKKLNGQLQVFYIKENGTKTETQSHPFLGVRDSENLSVNFTGSAWTDGLSGQTWSGTLKAKQLTLVVPSKDGTLQSIVFKPSSIDEYNNEIIQMKQNVTDNNKVIEENNIKQQNLKAEAALTVNQQNDVKSANQNLAENISDLANNVLSEGKTIVSDFDDVLGSYAKDWKGMQSDYTNMKNDAAVNPLTNSQINQVNSDVNQLNSDVNQINSDRNSFDSVLRSTERYVDSLEESIKKINAWWVFLQKSVSANTSGVPIAGYTLDDISKIVKSAQIEIDNTNAIIKSKTKQADKYKEDADQLYESATTFYNSLKPTD